MTEKTIRIFHWNVKYADPTKDSNAVKYESIARSIARVEADVVVLTEITSKADATRDLILAKLISFGKDYGHGAVLQVDGGNNEHHLFLVKRSSGYNVAKFRVIGFDHKGTRDYQIGAGTRGVGLININHPAHPTTYLRILSAHPSPCAYTNNNSVKNAQSVVQNKANGKNKNVAFAFMVADFNSESEGDGASTASVSKTGANTHSSGMELDFAVHAGALDVLSSGSRVQDRMSDHSYQYYDVKYQY
ncbi:MAG: endonuclease/exonuclease/phosphatase family protein [Gammaproteobacteria bacterium]|nr:MAG: endonuclease/exonuclease/phosphatase family protein [Gammaproteobacteria bacterium]